MIRSRAENGKVVPIMESNYVLYLNLRMLSSRQLVVPARVFVAFRINIRISVVCYINSAVAFAMLSIPFIVCLPIKFIQ